MYKAEGAVWLSGLRSGMSGSAIIMDITALA
jgi:hypothetical protein